ncbi:MAG: glycine cleavage T C-terminal barrel domain-containing protein, partial [Bryobacteraceae bacterium]
MIPCGLGARNTLRLEAAMPLYGHEISEETNVFEAGLERFLKLDKENFVGAKALREIAGSGVKRKLAGLEMVGRGIAREDYRVLDREGHEIGVVTSGSPAPFLKKNIALAYLPTDLTSAGTEVAVQVRGNPVDARVTPIPFYRRPSKRTESGTKP